MDVEDFLEIFFLSLPLAATFLRALARAVSRLLVLAPVCVLNHVLITVAQKDRFQIYMYVHCTSLCVNCSIYLMHHRIYLII